MTSATFAVASWSKKSRRISLPGVTISTRALRTTPTTSQASSSSGKRIVDIAQPGMDDDIGAVVHAAEGKDGHALTGHIAACLFLVRDQQG